jgi:hypothetical protein
MTDFQALIDESQHFAIADYPWVRKLRDALIEATDDRAEHDRQVAEKAWDDAQAAINAHYSIMGGGPTNPHRSTESIHSRSSEEAPDDRD